MSDRLIIEKSNGTIYCYFEDREHYHKVKSQRGVHIKKKDAQRILGNECNMSSFPDNSWFAVKVK